MKPTDKEYIEALAEQQFENPEIIDVELYSMISSQRLGLKIGYQLALEHTNHAELVEKAKAVDRVLEYLLPAEKNVLAEFLEEVTAARKAHLELKESLTKSETSKLNRKSCDKACSPSDFYKGGKCDKNGCHHE